MDYGKILLLAAGLVWIFWRWQDFRRPRETHFSLPRNFGNRVLKKLPKRVVSLEGVLLVGIAVVFICLLGTRESMHGLSFLDYLLRIALALIWGILSLRFIKKIHNDCVIYELEKNGFTILDCQLVKEWSQSLKFVETYCVIVRDQYGRETRGEARYLGDSYFFNVRIELDLDPRH